MKTMIGFGLFILLTSVLSKVSAYGCSCPVSKPVNEKTIDDRYANSEVIFTAQVVHFDEGKYTLKVTEVFKGEIEIDQVMNGDNSNQGECGPYIQSEGPFLIYGRFKNGTLLLNLCGYSRSISQPHKSTHYMLPPLPMNVESDEPTNEEIERHRREDDKRKLEIKLKAIRDIEFELEYLSSLKNSRE